MNFKYWVLVAILTLGVIFVTMDNCGSSRKADELKGQYEEASRIAKVERLIKEEVIKEQREKITKQDAKIKEQVSELQTQNKKLTEKEKELGDLKRDFQSLEECQAQYNKLVEGFTLAKKIIKELGLPIEYYDEHGVKRIEYPEGSVTFGLNEKYEKQKIISLEYKGMDKTSRELLDIRDKEVRELRKISKRLRLTSGIKTGFVMVLAGLIVYNMVK